LPVLPPDERSRISILARFLLLIGLSLLIYFYGWETWAWWLFVLGIFFYIGGLRRSGNLELLFPGTILLLFSGAMLFRQYAIVTFPLWWIWPLLFGSMGFGFLLMWLVHHSGSWVFFPGGLLIFMSAGGFGASSFQRYQIWLRKLFNHWRILLALLVVFMIVYLWRSRSIQKGSK